MSANERHFELASGATEGVSSANLRRRAEDTSEFHIMYAMVNAIGNVYNSVNQVYLAGLMTAPMIVIELLVMRGMYQDQRRIGLILSGAVVAGAVLFAFTRWQTGGRRPSVPPLDDPSTTLGRSSCASRRRSRMPTSRRWCSNFIKGQQEEIQQMKAKLRQSTQGY
jgi:hypothetical protein